MNWELCAVIVGVFLGILGIVQYACNVLNYIVIQPFQKSVTSLEEVVTEVKKVMVKLTERMEKESRAAEIKFLKLEQTDEAIIRRLEHLEAKHGN